MHNYLFIDGDIEGNVMLVSAIVTGVLLMMTIMALIIITIVCIARRRINKNRKRIMIFGKKYNYIECVIGYDLAIL